MQILLIILQLISLAILLFIIRQDKKIESDIKELDRHFSNLVKPDLAPDGTQPVFLVVKQWYDTGNTTSALIQAKDEWDAYNIAEDEDNRKKYTIVNIIRL